MLKEKASFNTFKPMKKKQAYNFFTLFAAVAILTLGCHTSKNPNRRDNNHITFGNIEIADKNLKQESSQVNKDQKGIIKTNSLVFSYDYSANAPSGPESVHDYLWKTFRSYHYLNFFDKIHIDKKVQKLFRDSLIFEKFETLPEGKSKDCKSCNYRLHITFKGYTYTHDVSVNSQLESELKQNITETFEKDGLLLKYFQTPKETGVYIKNKEGDKTEPKLNLTLISGSVDQCKFFINNNIRYHISNGKK